ncbi:hypothetical protein Dfri01_22570 [Dyadobacter frigoris]|nr:hypothetical protein Dfri01_22570 [Dyadobacter frigoris]
MQRDMPPDKLQRIVDGCEYEIDGPSSTAAVNIVYHGRISQPEIIEVEPEIGLVASFFNKVLLIQPF